MPRQLVTVDLFVNPSFNHTYTQTCVPFIHGTLNHSLLLLPKNLCCTKNSEPPNETKQACKQTKQQQQMHANHKAPSNLLIHMYGLCAVLCIEYLSFHFDIQKKSKTKHEQRQPKKKYWKCHRNEFTVDIRWPKTITHFTISFG